MDNPIPCPAGLAVLITLAIAILAPSSIDSAGPSAISRHAIARPVRRPAFTKQQLPKRDRLKELPVGMSKDVMSEDLRAEDSITKDLPVDIRAARLMLSVESLFKATTAN